MSAWTLRSVRLSKSKRITQFASVGGVQFRSVSLAHFIGNRSLFGDVDSTHSEIAALSAV